MFGGFHLFGIRVGHSEAGVASSEIVDGACVVDDDALPVGVDGDAGDFGVVGGPGFHIA